MHVLLPGSYLSWDSVVLFKEIKSRNLLELYGVYISDTVTYGRFLIKLGCDEDSYTGGSAAS
jgi:hypothetical protein